MRVLPFEVESKAMESVYMHQPTLDKHYLGFHPLSFSPEQSIHNPPEENGDVDDEIVLQSIVEEIQNLVLNQAFNEEVKEKAENEDEMVVQSIVEEVRNLVLEKAFSEERAKRGDIHDGIGSEYVKEVSENEYGAGGDCYEYGGRSWSGNGNAMDGENEKGGEEGYEDVEHSCRENEIAMDVENEKGHEVEGSKEWGWDGDHSWSQYGNNVIDVKNEKGGGATGSKEWGLDGDHSWNEYGNVIDVENEKGGEEGLKEWGFSHCDDSWRENRDVENKKGGEADLKEWGFSHCEDGDNSWRENGGLIDVENNKGGVAGSKISVFYRYEHGDDSWRGNGDVIDVENEKGGEAGSIEWGFNASTGRLIYPLRPDAMDCAYYMKTGTCQYGVTCKFNHPCRRGNQKWSMEKGKQKEESEERAGLIECKYYLTEGGCKYGDACKYNHSRKKDAISPVLDFNFLGLPIRPGEKDCPYYMRTGSCKYGSNCRFHHPDPTTVAGNNPSFGYNSGGSAPVQSASYSPVSFLSSPRASNETAPFIPVVYSTSQGIPPLGPQWNRFQAPVYPTSETSLPSPPAFAMQDLASKASPPAFAMQDLASKANFYPRPQQPWLVEEYYPEHPGQPDCSYFIKTGDCKYKSNCKFNHPKTQKSKTNPSVLSDKGLPLRPGQAVCSFYSRYGICKFGPACKFDHPEPNGTAASSPGFALYQPPFGNSATTDGFGMARKGNGNGSLVP